MKSIATWLWAAVAMVNLGVGCVITYTCRIMTRSYVEELGGAHLPSITELVLPVAGWPYGVAVLALLGAVLSVVIGMKREIAAIVIAAVLLTEVVGLALTILAVCLPFDFPLSQLSP